MICVTHSGVIAACQIIQNFSQTAGQVAHKSYPSCVEVTCPTFLPFSLRKKVTRGLNAYDVNECTNSIC